MMLKSRELITEVNSVNIFGKEMITFNDLTSAINTLNEGIMIEDNGMILEPFKVKDRLILQFPFIFYAEKYDRSESVLFQPGEASLSQWYKDLSSACYHALDHSSPILKRNFLITYLDYLLNHLKKTNGSDTQDVCKDIFFSIVCF